MTPEKQLVFIVVPKKLDTSLFIKEVATILVNFYKLDIERVWSKWHKTILTKKSKIKFVCSEPSKYKNLKKPIECCEVMFYYCQDDDTALDVAKIIRFVERETNV